MMRVLEELCHSATCTRPGCSPAAGCQGHAFRDMALSYYQARFEDLLREAELKGGVVVSIEQVPLLPLAMGHHRSVVSVRRKREIAL